MGEEVKTMRDYKTAAILSMLILAFAVAVNYFTLDDRQPQQLDKTEQLQAEVQQLRAEVEDVKLVQGWQSYYLEGARKP